MLSIILLWARDEYQGSTKDDESGHLHSSVGRRSSVLRASAGLSLALGVLLRPEGLFVAALLLAVRAWQDWREGRPVWRLLGWALLPFLVVIVPYQVWRIGFYGYPFPNTFYAKTGLTLALLERGLVYVGQFALPHWLIAVPAFLGVVGWLVAWIRARRKRSENGTAGLHVHSMLPALFLLTAVYTLYIIWVGGDHFPAMRFFVPLLVPMALLAQEAFRGGLRLVRANRSLTYAAAGALVVAVLVYAGISLWMQTDDGPLGQRGNRETTAWERWGSAALWLREETPPNTKLAAFAAGAMAYFSDRYTIDMLGLNDVHIAHVQMPNMGSEVAGHEKQDPSYVLGLRPDYILATWEDYFSPIAAQVTANYGYETVDSPTGTPVKWLRRNDAKGP
jgi:arabinofuranosyltransferase